MNTEAWRTQPLEILAPETLLQRGLDLLESLSDDPVPTLSWTRTSRPAIVLGRGQDRSCTTSGALEVHTRSSGGGAVLLTPDLLCLDIALPAGHPFLDSSVSAAFLPIGRAWAEALTGLGLTGLTVHAGASTARRRGSDRDRLLAAVCYATVGRGEVLARGRKLVGLSQRRRRQGALIQCGLLRRWEPGPLLTALGADPADADIRAAAVGLDELMPDPPPDEQVVQLVSRALTG